MTNFRKADESELGVGATVFYWSESKLQMLEITVEPAIVGPDENDEQYIRLAVKCKTPQTHVFESLMSQSQPLAAVPHPGHSMTKLPLAALSRPQQPLAAVEASNVIDSSCRCRGNDSSCHFDQLLALV